MIIYAINELNEVRKNKNNTLHYWLHQTSTIQSNGGKNKPYVPFTSVRLQPVHTKRRKPKLEYFSCLGLLAKKTQISFTVSLM